MEHASGTGSKIHFTLNTMGRRGDARQFLDDWIAELPRDGAANILASIDYLSAGNEELALRHLETAYREQPTNPIVLNNLAWLYRNTDIEQAIELARQAVTYTDGYADALDTLGWLLHLNGDSQEALPYLQQAADLAPDSQAIVEHLEAVRQTL